MKTLLKLEEASKLIAVYLLSLFLDYSWWTFLLLFFLPDLSMVAYLISSKVGAILYNFFHHYAVGISISVAGLLTVNNDVVLFGLVLIGHSAFDRLLGYGLKYHRGFNYTHLGEIGRKN